MARNPPWTRDELIIALNLYLQHEGRLPPMAAVDEVSRVLRLIAGRSTEPSENYRNRNAVLMKLGNFQAIDPAFVASGRSGLSRGARADRQVWEDFAHDRPRLAETAHAIVSFASNMAMADGDVEDGEEANEGRVLTRVHRFRERNAKLRAKKIASVLAKAKTVSCEVCDFDFENVYGARGRGFIEIHHRIPLHELSEARTTRLDELALVCANCHRMIHSSKPWLTIDTLKLIVATSNRH